MRHTTHATKPIPMPAPMPSMRRHRTGSAASRAARALVTALLVSLPLSGCGSSAPKPAATTSAAGVSVTPLSADQVESERKHFSSVYVRDLHTRYGTVSTDNSLPESDDGSLSSGVVTSDKPGSTDDEPKTKTLQWATRLNHPIFRTRDLGDGDRDSTTQTQTYDLLKQESSGVGVVSPDGQHISLILQPHRTAQDDDFSAQRTYVVVLSAETGTLEGSVEVSGLILGRVLTNDSLAIQTARNYYPGAEGQGVISVYPLSNLADKPSTISSDHWLIGASRDSLLLSPYSPTTGNDWSTRFRPFTVTQMGTDGTVRRTITGVNRVYPGGWLQRFSDPAAAATLAASTAGKDDDQTQAAWDALPTQIVDLNSGSTHDLMGGRAESVGVPTGPGLLISHEGADGNGSPQQFWLSADDDGHPHTENLEQFTSK